MTMRNLVSLIAVCFPLLFTGVAISAEKSKLVPMEVINSKGHAATLKDGTRVKVVHIVNRKNPKRTCRIDINSLKSMNVGKWAQATLGATAELSLQAHVDAEGPYCAGKGSGCVIIVEIPDAKVVGGKLAR